MGKGDFYKLDPIDKMDIFQAVSNKTGMPVFAVEKDWWVSKTLSIIFGMDIAKHLVFKGGTSLSKAWKLIERFSEDIDLAIDKEFFGVRNEPSRSKLTALRKSAGLYSSGIFFEELQSRFVEEGFQELKFKVIDAQDSDQDPRIIEIHYPNLVETPGYILPRIQIEIGCRSLREPFSIQTFGSLVDEVYADRDFVEPLFKVPTVNAERTFLEKIFLLHEEFKRPVDKRRVGRLSRHLYDVYQMSKAGISEKAILDQELYQTIVAHRYKFSRVGGVDYNKHKPSEVDPSPAPKAMADWKADYKIMLEQMIYEQNAPTFEMIIENLEDLKIQLKAIEWKFSLIFPKLN